VNVVERFLAAANAHPDAVALVDRRHGRDRSVTYASLEAESRRVAAVLRARGLAPGATVLVYEPPSIELYGALVAMFRLGLVAMVVEPSGGPRLLEAACALRPPAALLASRRAHLLRLVSPSVRRIPLKLSSRGWVPGAVRLDADELLEPAHDVVSLGDEAPALLTFTSGSTGRPKGAIRTHGILARQHDALADGISARAGELDLVALPIVVLANLGSGAGTVLPDADLRRPDTVDASRLLRQMARTRPSRITAPPAFLERLVAVCLDRGTTLPDIERIVTGGGPVFPDLVARLRRAMPRAHILSVYGSTEAEPIAHIADEEATAADAGRVRGGAGLLAGAPVSQVGLRVIRAAWGRPLPPMTARALSERSCARGEPGEVVVSGAHVVPGYVDGLGDEETKFRAAGTVWHRTGDVGYLDAAGRLWLLGRAEAVVRDARGAVHPFAVECAARALAGVRRAALVAHEGRRVLLVELDRALRREPPGIALFPAGAIDAVVVCRRVPMDRRHNSKVDYASAAKLLRRLRPQTAATQTERTDHPPPFHRRRAPGAQRPPSQRTPA
jgi:olefin beta-lactone synthetase